MIVIFYCLEQKHRKSISTERTFKPTDDISRLFEVLRHLCSELIHSLAKSAILGGNIATLTVKFENFDRITRSQSAKCRIDNVDNLYPIVETLLRKELDRKLKVTYFFSYLFDYSS